MNEQKLEYAKNKVNDPNINISIGIQKEKINSGLGFHSMEYRANQIGAKFSIKQNTPKGTIVELKIKNNEK